MSDKETARVLIENASKLHEKDSKHGDLKKLEGKIGGVSSQIEALAEHLTKIPKDMSPLPIFEQMRKLERLRDHLKHEFENAKRNERSEDLPTDFESYQKFLDLMKEIATELTPAELKIKIIQKLIHKIEVFEDSIKVHYFIGQSHIEPFTKGGPGDHSPGPSGSLLKPKAHVSPGFFSSPGVSAGFFNYSGSNKLTNGGAGGSRYNDNLPPHQVMGSFNYCVVPPYRNHDFLRQKYVEEGLSIKQISALTSSSKDAIRNGLLRAGIKLRDHGKPHGRPSQLKYGKRLLRGQEADHKVEQRVIDVIRDLRNQKMTLRKIGQALTQLGIPTKCRGKCWHPEMVRRVLGMAADPEKQGKPPNTAPLAPPATPFSLSLG